MSKNKQTRDSDFDLTFKGLQLCYTSLSRKDVMKGVDIVFTCKWPYILIQNINT